MLDQRLGLHTTCAYNYLVGAGDREDVADLAAFQGGAKVRIVAVDLVGRHPARCGSRVQCPSDHPCGENRLGREREVLWDTSGPAAVRVLSPRACYVQGPVDRGVPAGSGIDHVDGDLGVLDAASSARVLALDTDGRDALLQVPGLVDHEHRLGVVQMFHHIGADIVADCVGVPLRPVQQVLHPVRGRVTGVLSEGPTVLSRQVRQQTEHQCPRPTSWFDSGEPSCDAFHRLIEHRPPPGRGCTVARGHRRIFACPHNSR